MSLVGDAKRRGALDLIELHVFEPVAESLHELDMRTSSISSQVKLTKVQSALSRSDGTADMHIITPTGGTNSLHPNSMSPSESTTQVSVRKVDTYCKEKNIAEVHFLKCDAEGHDFDVLLGAMSMFGQQRIQFFQFEYNHRWIDSRHFLKDVFALFDGRPYAIGKLTGRGIEVLPCWHPELERFFESNYVIVHKAMLSQFSHRYLRIDAANTYA